MSCRPFPSALLVLISCLLLPSPAATFDDAESDESRFLISLFDLTGEVARSNAKARRWLLEDGQAGLHPLDYFEEIDTVRARIDALSTPRRLEPVRRPILEALELQKEFVRDWFRAIDTGQPFASQLTDELAYHEGLHRSHRLLLKAYAELLALFPELNETNRRAFRDHLSAMGFR